MLFGEHKKCFLCKHLKPTYQIMFLKVLSCSSASAIFLSRSIDFCSLYTYLKYVDNNYFMLSQDFLDVLHFCLMSLYHLSGNAFSQLLSNGILFIMHCVRRAGDTTNYRDASNWQHYQCLWTNQIFY